MIPVFLHGRGDGVLWENQRNRAVRVLTRKVASKQVLCLSDEIEGNIRDCPVCPVSTLGEADGMFWVMLGNVTLERGRGFVLSSLSLDGDDFCAMLQHEVDFSGFIRVISGGDLELPTELLQNIVFRERPFELILCFQEDRTVVDACHVLEKPRIKKEEFELVEFIEGG